MQIYNSGAANVASGVIQAGYTTLLGCIGINFGPQQYIMFFDSLTVPVDGTLVSLPWQVLPGSFAINLAPGIGRDFLVRQNKPGWPFFTGLVWSNSTTAPTKTLGAANIWLTAVYA